jgi:hypothetical protein
MNSKKRVETLRVLAGGTAALAASSKITDIYGEFNRIIASSKRNTPDGWLLTVLHTTRALDTSLSEILLSKGWHPGKWSLGSYIVELQKRAILSPQQSAHYQKSLVKKRNMYMHQAGAMPHGLESERILTDMHACFVVVVSML